MSLVEAVINGRPYTGEIADNTLLLDFIRDGLGLFGTKQSCEVQVCGACTVLVDGRPVSSCCFLAVDIDGAELETIEGLAGSEFYARAADAFMSHAAVQCGFCIPAFLLTLKSIDAGPTDRAELRTQLRGNLCRCTGYQGILAAAEEALGLS